MHRIGVYQTKRSETSAYGTSDVCCRSFQDTIVVFAGNPVIDVKIGNSAERQAVQIISWDELYIRVYMSIQLK